MSPPVGQHLIPWQFLSDMWTIFNFFLQLCKTFPLLLFLSLLLCLVFLLSSYQFLLFLSKFALFFCQYFHLLLNFSLFQLNFILPFLQFVLTLFQVPLLTSFPFFSALFSLSSPSPCSSWSSGSPSAPPSPFSSPPSSPGGRQASPRASWILIWNQNQVVFIILYWYRFLLDWTNSLTLTNIETCISQAFDANASSSDGIQIKNDKDHSSLHNYKKWKWWKWKLRISPQLSNWLGRNDDCHYTRCGVTFCSSGPKDNFLSQYRHWWGVFTIPKALFIPSIMFLLVTDEGLIIFLTFICTEKEENSKKHFFALLRKFCHRGDVPAGYRRPPQGFPYGPKS